jgi:RNA recognition motif-containing protein
MVPGELNATTNRTDVGMNAKRDCQLFVGNLSFTVSKATLQQVFCQYGHVLDIKIVEKSRHDGARTAPNIAFVEFHSRAAVEKAVAAASARPSGVRTIHLMLLLPLTIGLLPRRSFTNWLPLGNVNVGCESILVPGRLRQTTNHGSGRDRADQTRRLRKYSYKSSLCVQTQTMLCCSGRPVRTSRLFS